MQVAVLRHLKDFVDAEDAKYQDIHSVSGEGDVKGEPAERKKRNEKRDIFRAHLQPKS